ncbi:hypothetical protein OAS19_03750 [Altererythrobacter sp.]|nr:hypothetical protein [Altererythrobacter sp.]
MEYKFARDAARKEFHIGWLTPLLAVFVMLDLLSFWIFAWTTKDLISVSPPTLMGVIFFACAYYLAARLVFPTEPDDFTDLEVHFYRVRRIVLGILIALVFVQWGFLASQITFAPLIQNPVAVTLTVLLIALMALVMLLKRDLWNIILLVALIIRYFVIYLL